MIDVMHVISPPRPSLFSHENNEKLRVAWGLGYSIDMFVRLSLILITAYPTFQVDIFSYGVMMIHVLSGQWPFPGEAVRVNPQNPDDPNDLVGVTEFDRREEHINKIGNQHPLMTLIRQCLSNSPSHRPTSSDVHHQVTAMATDHPPSFANRVEMLERIKSLQEEKETVRMEKDNIVAENNQQILELEREKEAAIAGRERLSVELEETQSKTDSLCQAHSIALKGLHLEISDLNVENKYLRSVLCSIEEKHKSEQDTARHSQERKLEAMKKREQIERERSESQMEDLKSNHQKEIQLLKEQHIRELAALEDDHCTMKQVMEKHHQVQLETKLNELSSKDALIASKSSTIQGLQVKLERALETAPQKDILNVFSQLTFTECAKCPVPIYSGQAVVVGKDVYLYNAVPLKYSTSEDSWCVLPRAPVQYFRFGCLFKKILLVGGRLPSRRVTADIHEFDEATQQWVRSTTIPPMPTARSSVTAVSWTSPPALIVCGGNNPAGEPMTVVEIYHSRTSQWHTTSPLPFPRSNMTHTIIHNILFLVGGYARLSAASCKKTVLSVSIPQLLESCLQPSTSPIQWQSLSISDVPNYRSTAALLGACLLVVGGKSATPKFFNTSDIVSSIHAYCPSFSSWVLVGELPQPCYDCATATLPTGELLVIGGVTSKGTLDTVYKFTVS